MKLTVIFLLLTATVYSQQAKLTTYRLINPVDDGPCSIKSYVEHPDVFSGSFVTAESDDLKLIEKLLSIKANCKKWPQKPLYCGKRMLEGDEIPNMLVITGKRNDTIFTDKTNRWIIFPEQQKAYKDEKGIFKASLSGSIKDFFDYNFDWQLRVKFLIETVDSVSVNSISYRGQTLKNNVIEIPETQEKYRLGTGNSKKIYVTGNDTITIDDRRTSTIINDKAGPFSVNGLRPGDSEQQLKKHYPVSASIPVFYHTRFEDMQRKYYYLVTIEKGIGNVVFMITDGIIESIQINLESSTS